MRLLLLKSLTSILAASVLAGCGGTQYAEDPANPRTPFAFPGQNATGQLTSAPVAVNPNAMVPAAPQQPQQSAAVVRVGDRLEIKFSDIPLPPAPFEVRIPDGGKITLPYNITVNAVGKTVGQLQDEIQKAYVPDYYRRLTVTITTEERFYFVGGEVRQPARQPYAGDLSVLRAIDSVGGFTEFANRKKIELRRANGQTHMLNWNKVIQNPKLDLPVYPNDQITVHKKNPFGF